jgi:hypothetical protein
MAKSHNLASDFTKSLGVAKNVATLAKKSITYLPYKDIFTDGKML